jgi:hypothetical protein
MIESLVTLVRWNGGYPGELEFASIDTLETTPANPELEVFLEAAANLTKNWRGGKFAGLYLYGTPGNGKTHAALGLGRALHDEGAKIYYRYAPALNGNHEPIGSWNGVESQLSSGVFPSSWHGEARPNSMRVLIFDDYRPEKQIALHSAVEAGAQFGGLVVVTSNYEDPFKLVEIASPEPTSLDEILKRDYAERVAPDEVMGLNERQVLAAKTISESLRSRISYGFRLINFTGPDRRQSQSFWD